METIIIGGIILLATSYVVHRICQYLINVQEEQNEIVDAIIKLSEEYADSYSFTPADEKLKNDTVNFLQTECPNGLGEQLKQYNTHEDRKEYVKEFVLKLADTMGVELEGVLVEDDMPDKTLGLFQDQGYVSINAVIMEADPERILMTIVHELRHGVQYQSCLAGKDHWGFSTETKAIWYYNWNHYINEPYSIYVLQPLEYDANTFANAVIQSYKS